MEGQGPLDRTPLPVDTNRKIYDRLPNERLPELGGASGVDEIGGAASG